MTDITFCEFKVYSTIVWYGYYCKMTVKRSVNSPHVVVCVCVCVRWQLWRFTLSDSQVWRTALLTVVATLHVGSQELVYSFYSWKVVPFDDRLMLPLPDFVLLALRLYRSLYILDINPLLGIWFANTVSHSVSCLFTLLLIFSPGQKLCSWM